MKHDFISDPRFAGIKPFEKKIWLSSPTMHGDEQHWVDDAIDTNWVSTVGANINEVERMAAERGLDQKVVFAGSVDNVEDYLQAMDVFAFPSRFEGLGIVAIEAQANGLPVIASEAVPRDAAVSPHMVFIKQNIEAWTRQVKAYENIGRTDNKELLYDHGYDVEETAKRIRSLYTI